MKKIIALLTLSFCFAIWLSLPFYSVYAEEATQENPPSFTSEPSTGDTLIDEPVTDLPPTPANRVFLTAPKALRAGEEVTFHFLCEGDELRAAQGSITYDPSVLTYVGSKSIPSDWEMTFAEAEGTLKYLGLSTENRGLSGNAELFSLTFRIAEAAVEGTGIPFVLSDTTAYNGTEELLLTGGKFTFAVTRPLSTDNKLSALSIAGGNLSPSFSPDITEYSVTLPYTTYYADLSATACDYAEIKLSSRELKVGENQIRVTVIAEAGDQKVYTITVTRLSDPNYVPSSDNRILSLKLSDGLLFPSFSPEITEYTVYLVKGHDVTLQPTPADKAVAEQITIPAEPSADSTEEAATAGSFTILCYAEDGTPRTYTFHTVLLNTPDELNQVQTSVIAESPLTAILIFSFAAVTVFFLGFVVSYLFHARNGKKESAAPSDVNQPDETK